MMDEEDNRLELTLEQHNILWFMFLNRPGTQLHSGEHEGTTLECGDLYLCQADGVYWLATKEAE